MWWRWFRWVLVGLFAASWVPSLFNVHLAWLWMGTGGVLLLMFGLFELLAPSAFLEWRRTYLSQAPQWEQRLASSFERSVPPRPAIIRVIGATLAVFGAVMLVSATMVFVRVGA